MPPTSCFITHQTNSCQASKTKPDIEPGSHITELAVPTHGSWTGRSKPFCLTMDHGSCFLGCISFNIQCPRVHISLQLAFTLVSQRVCMHFTSTTTSSFPSRAFCYQHLLLFSPLLNLTSLFISFKPSTSQHHIIFHFQVLSFSVVTCSS